MKKQLVVGALSTLIATSVFADDRVLISPHLTGEEFVLACTASPDLSEGMASFFLGECRGAVSAATDAMELEQLAFNLPRHFCPPQDAVTKDLVGVVVGYIAARPDRKGDPAALLIRSALDKAYPCKK